MVQDVARLVNPNSSLKKRSLDVGFPQSLLLMHLGLHATAGYWVRERPGIIQCPSLRTGKTLNDGRPLCFCGNAISKQSAKC